MAKRYDNDFDAEGFVENFRAKEYPPTSPAAPDELQKSSHGSDDAPVKKEKSVNPRIRKEKPSDMAVDYQATFIDDLKYRFPDNGWSQVKIHPNFKAMILYLENLCRSHRANLSTFINNVLEQHFRDYETQIEEIKKKYNENE